MMRRELILVLLLLLGLGACRIGEDEQEVRVLAETPSGRAFNMAVEEALPAVVFIEVEPRQRALGRQLQFPFGSPDTPGRQQPSAGSGVLFDSDGYILTSSHVVRDAYNVMVTLYDRRTFEGRVLARDPSTDVAVVKVDASDLPAAALGDSDRLELGEWVLALGSPLGLLFTVTSGVVSAKGRQVGIIGRQSGGETPAAPLEHFIQTDAAINPGNSGGPLINLAGRVIGINTAIVSPTGVSAGIGFAVPINLARSVARDLIEHGEVRRAFMGVILEEVSPADAEVYGLDTPRGAEILSVQEGSPAAEAGLEVGDVVVGIGDRDVETVSDLQAALAGRGPGTEAVLHIVRDGRERDVTVELGVVRSGMQPEPPPPDADDGQDRLGFRVAEQGGDVVISAIRPASAAAHAGARPGQVLLSVNDREVESLDDFEEALQAVEDGIISLRVRDPQLGPTIINFRVDR